MEGLPAGHRSTDSKSHLAILVCYHLTEEGEEEDSSSSSAPSSAAALAGAGESDEDDGGPGFLMDPETLSSAALSGGGRRPLPPAPRSESGMSTATWPRTAALSDRCCTCTCENVLMSVCL